MAESANGIVDPRNDRLEEYVERFGSAPPLLYMADMSDDEFSARIAQAIDSGVAIDDDEFEGDASEHTTVH